MCCRTVRTGVAGGVHRLVQPAVLPAVPPPQAPGGKAGSPPNTKVAVVGTTWDVAALVRLLQRGGGCRVGPAAISLMELVSCCIVYWEVQLLSSQGVFLWHAVRPCALQAHALWSCQLKCGAICNARAASQPTRRLGR